jgi:GT2 family glycosyltransferase
MADTLYQPPGSAPPRPAAAGTPAGTPAPRRAHVLREDLCPHPGGGVKGLAAGDPEISVIVPHLNQPETLRACLAALAAQDLAPERFEVIVVDNGSATPPAAVVAGFPGVRLAVEPAPGPGLARNRGAALARGGILAFTDADCRPEPGWLAALAAGFADPDVAVLGGRVAIFAADPAAPTPAENFDIVYGMRQDRLIAGQGFAATANLAVRRDAFAAVGPFAGIALAEDMDWGQRAAARGFPVRYAPAAVVRHPARRSLAALARQWDRHIGHAWAALPPGPLARLRWLGRAAAVAASPLATAGPLLASRRLAGPGQRLGAFGVLVRLRLYRARRMLAALGGGAARQGGHGWNR